MDTFKVLGQSALATTTLTDVYTVPALTAATLSSIVVCNRSSATTFRISVAPAGAADATSQYLYYDTPIAANDTFIATIGLTLATTDVLRAYAGSANITVSAYGIELT